MIYKSVQCPEKLSDAALQALVEKASVNNDKTGITGVLLISGDRFLQVLEGPVKFVNQLYRKIVVDERHKDVELISYETVSTTFFHDWSMKLLKLDKELPPKLRETLVNKYSQQDGHIVIPNELFQVHALLLDARWGLLNAG